MKEIVGNISSIETGFVDGPGVRAVVYFQGCPLRCLYCHNPETWETINKNLMTPNQVMEKISRYKAYFGKDGGITFSGGEPLMQPKFLLEVLKLCKKEGYHTAIDTSGYGVVDGDLLDYVDLVILDVKSVDENEYKYITGKDINTFNNFLNLVQQKNIPLWIRQVIVPNINDTKESILKLKDFVKNIKNVQKVELLPYHDMAKNKYKKLNINYRLENTKPMDKNKLKELEKILLN